MTDANKLLSGIVNAFIALVINAIPKIDLEFDDKTKGAPERKGVKHGCHYGKVSSRGVARSSSSINKSSSSSNKNTNNNVLVIIILLVMKRIRVVILIIVLVLMIV